MLVSIEYQRLGQFFKNTLGNIFTQARSLIFRCSKLHLKIRFFFDGPLHYFIKCYGKTCKLFLITVDTQTHAGAAGNFNLLKSASKTKICNRNPVGFFLCKLPWKSDLFLMAPCVILLRDMEKNKRLIFDYCLISNSNLEFYFRSVVEYVPRTELDYGSLLCWVRPLK